MKAILQAIRYILAAYGALIIVDKISKVTNRPR